MTKPSIPISQRDPNKYYLDPPLYSDGVDLGEHEHSFELITDYKSLTTSKSCLSIFGKALYAFRYKKDNDNAVLTCLPKGYSIKKGSKSNFIFGHPSGSKYPNMTLFTPHIIWLERRSRKEDVCCECIKCKKKEEKTLQLEDESNLITIAELNSKMRKPPALNDGTRVDLESSRVLRKLVISKKHRFPPQLQKPKKKKVIKVVDTGLHSRKVNTVDCSQSSLKGFEKFIVSIPTVKLSPETDYLLKIRVREGR